MNLAGQHLSDEAVTAFADGMLSPGPAARAGRHTAQCPECADAVTEQRAAVCALRSAAAPMLPAGLLERLRAVPLTTPLSPRPLSLAPDGSAVFPAYGVNPDSVGVTRPESTHFRFPVAVPRHLARRTQQFALVTAAVAVLTAGVAVTASASTRNEERAPSVSPGGVGSVRPAVYPRPGGAPAQLVNPALATSVR